MFVPRRHISSSIIISNKSLTLLSCSSLSSSSSIQQQFRTSSAVNNVDTSNLTAREWENLGIAAKSTNNNNANAMNKKKKIDKKFVPPPPVFGFAATKPEQAEKLKEQQEKLLQQQLDLKKNLATSSTAPSMFGKHSHSNNYCPHIDNGSIAHLYGPNVKVVRLSVQDALEEFLVEEFRLEQDKLQKQKIAVLSGSSSTSTLNQQQHNQFTEKSASQNQQRVVIVEQPEGKPNLPPLETSQQKHQMSENNNSNNAGFDSTPTVDIFAARSTGGALRAPEDIIVVLRPFLQSSGQVAFENIPPKVIRQLVGHDGFGANPSLIPPSPPKADGGGDEESGNENLQQVAYREKLRTFEDVLESICRVMAPVGVLAVDKKRSVIKLKPGISQLAARIDAGMCELNGGSLKKVTFSAIWTTLTGAERTFASDVGGLARVALCFPSQFVFPSQDLIGVQRTSVSPEYAKAKMMQSSNSQQQQQASGNIFASSAENTSFNSSESSTDGNNCIFQQGVQQFNQGEHDRKNRMTTGQSLLKQGESIVMDEENDD